MSSENGKPNGDSRILSLDGARKPKEKGSDWATKQDVANIIASEVSKVHEYYLNQIPAFVARMIQDSLMSYGLITVQAGPEGTPIVGAATVEAPVVSEIPSGDTSTADTTPTAEPGQGENGGLLVIPPENVA